MNTHFNRLKEVSFMLGQDASLIQATGGNTSVKDDEILWIKASGKNLANALKEDIFVCLDLMQVRSEIKKPAVQSYSFQQLSNHDLRPSIETSLHALMPHRAVLHTHPIDIIAVSLLADAKVIFSRALSGIAWNWVPYCRPGKPLTQSIDEALARNPADVLILQNHGLVVGADCPDKAVALQADVLQRIFKTPRSFNAPNVEALTDYSSHIEGVRLPDANVIHSLATDPWSFELAQCNPPYPDHVVFCGIQPHILRGKTQPKEAQYCLIPGLGVILLPTATKATEAMLQAQAEVYLRIQPNQSVNLLTDAQCAELQNWDAEQYRKALQSAA